VKQGEAAAAAYRGAGVEGGLDEVARASKEHVEVPPSLGLRQRRVRGSHRQGCALPCLRPPGEETTNLGFVTGAAEERVRILCLRVCGV
jgi:hypothetical protein